MLERYTYGSADSKDYDVMVVVESIPTIEEAKKLIEQYKVEYQPLYDKPLDIHLMVEDPTNYIEVLKKLNPRFITVHAEIPDYKKYIERIPAMSKEERP